MEFRVGINNGLVQSNDGVFGGGNFVVVFILGYEDYTGEVDAGLVGVITGIMAAGLGVKTAATASGGGATADVRGEEDGGEEDQEAESDGDGVAEADAAEFLGERGLGGRG